MAATRLQKMERDRKEAQEPEVAQRELDILRETVSRLGESVPLQAICANLLEQASMAPSVVERRAHMAAANTLFRIMVDRHQQARDLEQAGKEEQAIALYEENVRDAYAGVVSYDRLRAIYTARKDWDNARRVCQSYLALSHPDRRERQTFQGHLEQLRPE